MKHPSKACIVCGRPVPRASQDIMVRPPSLHKGQNSMAEVVADLRTLADCARYTNQPHILSAIRTNGLIVRFTVWDGESYRHHGFFCTSRCAADQGYASAQHGTRFKWSVPA